MSKPIKETPILYGKDAESFAKKIKENETKKVSKEEYERVINIYNKMKQKIKEEI